MAIAVACLIEKYGGAVGSVIGTVPSTIIPALFIILSDNSKSVADRVNSGLACMFGIFSTNVCFMPVWKVLPPRLPKKWPNGLSVLVCRGHFNYLNPASLGSHWIEQSYLYVYFSYPHLLHRWVSMLGSSSHSCW